jgi:hypothetical protein
MLRIVNWKSWKFYILLLCLTVALGAALVASNDTIQFFCKLHFGSAKMKQDCLDRLFDAEGAFVSSDKKPDGVPLPPEWTWRYLVSDRNPKVRIMIAKILWYLHPAEKKWLSTLVAETDNPDPEIRFVALGEFWDMNDCFTTVAPILRKHLFEDKNEEPRRTACLTLLPLSQQHPEARGILNEAANNLGYESTKEFVKRNLKSWDERMNTELGARTNHDSTVR